MAQKTVVVDDLTEEVVDIEEAHTGVSLMFEGNEVVLDLSTDSYNALAEAVNPYLEAGQSVRILPTERRVAAPRQRADRDSMQEIRKWARKNGYKVSERGRIPYAVMDAFTKSHLPQRASNGR